MSAKRIEQLPRATEIPTDDTLVAFEDRRAREFRYTTIGDIRRKTVYAHRNGETENPTTPGFYWFDGLRVNISGNKLWVRDLLEIDDNGYIDPQGSGLPVAAWDGEWWGPIVPPWEQSE